MWMLRGERNSTHCYDGQSIGCTHTISHAATVRQVTSTQERNTLEILCYMSRQHYEMDWHVCDGLLPVTELETPFLVAEAGRHPLQWPANFPQGRVTNCLPCAECRTSHGNWVSSLATPFMVAEEIIETFVIFITAPSPYRVAPTHQCAIHYYTCAETKLVVPLMAKKEMVFVLIFHIGDFTQVVPMYVRMCATPYCMQ